MTPAQILTSAPATLSPDERRQATATLALAVARGEVDREQAERWLERLRAVSG